MGRILLAFFIAFLALTSCVMPSEALKELRPFGTLSPRLPGLSSASNTHSRASSGDSDVSNGDLSHLQHPQSIHNVAGAQINKATELYVLQPHSCQLYPHYLIPNATNHQNFCSSTRTIHFKASTWLVPFRVRETLFLTPLPLSELPLSIQALDLR